MSIRWGTVDLISAETFLDTLRTAINNPAEPAHNSTELVQFLRNLGKTLNGLICLSDREPQLTWDNDLVEHANIIRTGIDDLRKSVEHTTSTLSTTCAISKAGSFIIGDGIQNLQSTVSRSQLVLDVFINLRDLSSLLEQSRRTTRTVEQLKAETQQVCCILPSISSSIPGLEDRGSSQFATVKDVQQYAEFLVRADLDDTTTSLLELQDVQIPLSQESRDQWQADLGLIIEALLSCYSNHLEVLLERKSNLDIEVIQMQQGSWQKAINLLVQIVDGELAGGLSIAFALESGREPDGGYQNMQNCSPSSPLLEGIATKVNPEIPMDNERKQGITIPSPKKSVQLKSYLPIPARSVQPTSKVIRTHSANSSDKENSYMKATRLAYRRFEPASNNLDWATSPSASSKPTWGSKSNQTNRTLTPTSKFNTRVFQRHNRSVLSHEVSIREKRPTKSMLGSDQYSFALERWVNESDHLEMLLNTGEHDGKQDIELSATSTEDYASAIGRFPQVLLKSMADWDDVYNPTTVMSVTGQVQIAT